MQETYYVQWHTSISDIDKDAWNRLTASNETPFYQWEWLQLLESSGSITPENGWTPVHISISRDDVIVACAPLYMKTHSMGEFVYDFAWADVAAQLGLDYYPKLVGTSPATPSGAFSFFADEDFADAGALLLSQILEFIDANSLSGVSFLFVSDAARTLLAEKGFSEWKHQSYLWENEDFSSFDDYLSHFSKNQRRNIRREIASIEDQGLHIETLWIEDSSREQRIFLYDMYEKTTLQFGPWAAKFLTREFFLDLHRIDGKRVLLFAAVDNASGEWISISMLVVKGNRMYGRYWGTRRFVKNMHFVLCYYEPIKYAICNGIRTFDPGAGSPHKLRRGFRAVTVSSMHYFRSPLMNQVFHKYIPEVNQQEEHNIHFMNTLIPCSNIPPEHER